MHRKTNISIRETTKIHEDRKLEHDVYRKNNPHQSLSEGYIILASRIEQSSAHFYAANKTGKEIQNVIEACSQGNQEEPETTKTAIYQFRLSTVHRWIYRQAQEDIPKEEYVRYDITQSRKCNNSCLQGQSRLNWMKHTVQGIRIQEECCTRTQ